MMNSTDFDYIKGSEKPRDTGSVYQSKDSNSARPQLNVNVSAAYSYLSVLTREQGKLPDELASAQATLQRHIATLASDPQRAENANPVPQEKPLLELASKMLLRNAELQEQVADAFTTRMRLVKTSEAVDELRSYAGTLPRIFQESNEPGRALMRYLCEVIVNYSTADNISPATARQLARHQIFAPDGDLTPEGSRILSRLMDATIEFIRENQPDVISSLGREGVQVVSPSDRKIAMANFLERAVASLPDDAIVSLSREEDSAEADELSKEMAQRVRGLIQRAARIAKEGNLLPENQGPSAASFRRTMDFETMKAEAEGAARDQENAARNQEVADLSRKLSLETRGLTPGGGTPPEEMPAAAAPAASGISEAEPAVPQAQTDAVPASAASGKDPGVFREAVTQSLAAAISSAGESELQQARNDAVTDEHGNIDLLKEFERFNKEENPDQDQPSRFKKSEELSGEAKKITQILSNAAALAKGARLISDSASGSLRDIPRDVPRNIPNSAFPDIPENIPGAAIGDQPEDIPLKNIPADEESFAPEDLPEVRLKQDLKSAGSEGMMAPSEALTQDIPAEIARIADRVDDREDARIDAGNPPSGAVSQNTGNAAPAPLPESSVSAPEPIRKTAVRTQTPVAPVPGALESREPGVNQLNAVSRTLEAALEGDHAVPPESRNAGMAPEKPVPAAVEAEPDYESVKTEARTIQNSAPVSNDAGMPSGGQPVPAEETAIPDSSVPREAAVREKGGNPVTAPAGQLPADSYLDLSEDSDTAKESGFRNNAAINAGKSGEENRYSGVASGPKAAEEALLRATSAGDPADAPDSDVPESLNAPRSQPLSGKMPPASGDRNAAASSVASDSRPVFRSPGSGLIGAESILRDTASGSAETSETPASSAGVSAQTSAQTSAASDPAASAVSRNGENPPPPPLSALMPEEQIPSGYDASQEESFQDEFRQIMDDAARFRSQEVPDDSDMAQPERSAPLRPKAREAMEILDRQINSGRDSVMKTPSPDSGSASITSGTPEGAADPDIQGRAPVSDAGSNDDAASQPRRKMTAIEQAFAEQGITDDPENSVFKSSGRDIPEAEARFSERTETVPPFAPAGDAGIRQQDGKARDPDYRTAAMAVSEPEKPEKKPGLFARMSRFFRRGSKSAAAGGPSLVKSMDLPANVKNISMESFIRSLSSVSADGQVTPEIRQMAASIHDAMMNPLGDLRAVSEWLGFVRSPLNASGPRGRGMQQWALMLLSIRFRQLGKDIDKFVKSRAVRDIIRGALSGEQKDASWSHNALRETLIQVERMQQLTREQDAEGIPSYIPVPPSSDETREGGVMISHRDLPDGDREWNLNFFFDLPSLGPLQIRTGIRVPDIKISIVAERLEALERVRATSDVLYRRLEECGFKPAPIGARLGTVYPPVSAGEGYDRNDQDGFSVKI
ncbi:hypothetical protein [Succinimonas sp.]|uniref:flagellar hook-length control protein FliK n=1 Tax=Succinimonas sp. TaxID=1936151 RepID=UPI003864B92B